VVDVTCEGLEEGCTYREVVASPFGNDEMLLRVEELTPGDRFTIHCMNTGTFVRIALAEARGGTFLEAEMGMEPWKLGYRLFDAVIGKRYFDRWLEKTVEGLERAARSRSAAIG
jgi:hypothetical protein